MTPNETALRLAMDLRNGTLLPSETDEAAENIEVLVAERRPLMDDQLCDLWYWSPDDVIEFARAIEWAHGIGEQT